MRQDKSKESLLQYINILVDSFDVSLSEIYNKFFHDYNDGIETDDGLTVVGIKGYLHSRQEGDMVVSTMWFEYSILKEPYSERKESYEVQRHSILDKKLSHQCTIRQLERNFDVIVKRINKIYLFPSNYISQFANIEVDVKIGSKVFHRSLEWLIYVYLKYLWRF